MHVRVRTHTDTHRYTQALFVHTHAPVEDGAGVHVVLWRLAVGRGHAPAARHEPRQRHLEPQRTQLTVVVFVLQLLLLFLLLPGCYGRVDCGPIPLL